MINFTIPGTGSSGHLCGGMLLSALLGPYAGFLTMIGVLFDTVSAVCRRRAFSAWLQYMEYGILWVLYRGPADLETDDAPWGIQKKIVAASVLGCVLTLQLGAFSVTLETLASGITELPFQTFVAVMQPIHLAIGLVEGLITAAVLCFVYDARPELLWGTDESTQRQKARFL